MNHRRQQAQIAPAIRESHAQVAARLLCGAGSATVSTSSRSLDDTLGPIVHGRTRRGQPVILARPALPSEWHDLGVEDNVPVDLAIEEHAALPTVKMSLAQLDALATLRPLDVAQLHHCGDLVPRRLCEIQVGWAGSRFYAIDLQTTHICCPSGTDHVASDLVVSIAPDPIALCKVEAMSALLERFSGDLDRLCAVSDPTQTLQLAPPRSGAQQRCRHPEVAHILSVDGLGIDLLTIGSRGARSHRVGLPRRANTIRELVHSVDAVLNRRTFGRN